MVIIPFLHPGGHYPDHEDEEADQQRPAADGAGGDPEEHVSPTEEDDQGADRVAHRTQVHKEGRDRHQHLHLHGLSIRGRLSRSVFNSWPAIGALHTCKRGWTKSEGQGGVLSAMCGCLFVFVRRSVLPECHFKASCLSLLPSDQRGTVAWRRGRLPKEKIT